jgi:hypothetical protein
MKRFCLFLFVLLSVLTSSAQTLGIKINPEADMMQGTPVPPHFGISCGLFYNQKIYKVLGFSAGIEYEQIRSYTPPDNFEIWPNNPYATPTSYKYIQQRTHLLEAPFDITLMMNENKAAKCLAYFTIGYAFGEIFDQQTVYAESSRTSTTSILNLPSKKMMTNSFRMGLEFRYNPKPRVDLAFGIQYKYKWLPESLGNDPNAFNVLGAYVKTGLNFLHKKTATPAKKS